uniref:Uncharacterized protein n=1 Tax=Meloidogyne enterolobii TaxID=390850 RepID=A0A6V7UI96_MELEN|nr:unnamed protein product [Meloidogyne enterolobii]
MVDLEILLFILLFIFFSLFFHFFKKSFYLSEAGNFEILFLLRSIEGTLTFPQPVTSPIQIYSPSLNRTESLLNYLFSVVYCFNYSEV